MGADRGAHILADQPLLPLNIAKLLAAVAKKEDASLFFLGKQAIDDDCNQTGKPDVCHHSQHVHCEHGCISGMMRSGMCFRADACSPIEMAPGNLCFKG